MTIWPGMLSDARLAARRLAQEPAFTLTCVLTLALGIGGNTAVFTLIDRVMLQPLPVTRPAELYRLGDTDACCVNSGMQGSFALFSYDLYLQLKNAAPQFRELAAFQASAGGQVTVGHPDGTSPPAAFGASLVSGNFFDMLGVSPAAGRLFSAADDRAGAPTVAVISHRLWRDRYQANPQIGGTAVLLNGVPATIVGVAPQGFYGALLRPSTPDFWIPISNEPLLQPQARLIDAKPLHWLYAIGRLAPGSEIGELNTRLTTVLQQWLADMPELSRDERARIPQQRIEVVSAARGANNTRTAVGPSLRLLQAIAGAVLLIACANLANLLLARGVSRRTETAVRVALGAPRRRLIAQVLTESVLLACAGGLAGLLLAYVGARAIVEMTFRGASNVAVNPMPSLLVLTFAFAVSLVTGAIFGVAPAIVGSRSDPIEAMRGAGRSTGDRGSRLRQTLIALQVAVSLVLVACAGLLGRSLINLQQQDFGFRSEGRYVASLVSSLGAATPQELASIYTRMRERLARIPGVAGAALALYSPMSGDNWSGGITVEGHESGERLFSSWVRVSPGYFAATGTPVLRGRAIDERDRPDSPVVAVVNHAFARRFFGDADPIGKRFGPTDAKGAGIRDIEIVGVVGDAKYRNARLPAAPMFFVPYLQQPAATAGRPDRSNHPRSLVIHTTAAVRNLEREVRQAIAEVDRRITVRTLTTMEEQVAQNFNMERVIARLTTVFGLIALLLACLGLYGVTAYWVARRTREIGIRMAVGASRGRVLNTVLRGAIWQLAIGLGIGLPAAIAAGRLLESRLYAVGSADPAVLTGALAVLALCGITAATIPARRAASTDPVRALRTE
jgi:macrolide transport system ATP-binding/permease protein